MIYSTTPWGVSVGRIPVKLEPRRTFSDYKLYKSEAAKLSFQSTFKFVATHGGSVPVDTRTFDWTVSSWWSASFYYVLAKFFEVIVTHVIKPEECSPWTPNTIFEQSALQSLFCQKIEKYKLWSYSSLSPCVSLYSTSMRSALVPSCAPQNVTSWCYTRMTIPTFMFMSCVALRVPHYFHSFRTCSLRRFSLLLGDWNVLTAERNKPTGMEIYAERTMLLKVNNNLNW